MLECWVCNHECTIRYIVIEDLGMRKICAKIVQKVLSDEQEAARATISYDLLEQCESYSNFSGFFLYPKYKEGTKVPVDAFQDVPSDGRKRWHRCSNAEGSYLEKF